MKGYKMGVPMLGAKEFMLLFHEAGHTLVVFTVRANTPRSSKAVADWLEYFGIPYDQITNEKGNADIYVDDKGYRFDTWPALSRLVDVLEPPSAADPKTEGPLPDASEW